MMLKMVMAAMLAMFGAVMALGASTPIAADAPELAPRGKFSVGTSELVVTAPDQVDVLHGPGNGSAAPRGLRLLNVVLWYPAVGQRGATGQAAYRMPAPDIAGGDLKAPAIVVFTGTATRGAVPAAGRFPIVILSHGFGNRAVMFSELGENLASKGYIVAAIEHDDATSRAGVSRQLSFVDVVIHRSADQRFVVAELLKRARSAKTGILAHADPENVALAGYSMGGFGALATAGAGYAAGSSIAARLPKGLLDPLLEGAAKPLPGIKALVLFAPWGGAPLVRMWTPAALATIRAPTLLIDGDRDDIVDFKSGVRWIFDQMSGADRHLLIYREARHNIAMNAAPDALRYDHRYLDRYDEPVWRKDRILAVNAHFITAFLDQHLKHVPDRAAFFAPLTTASDDGDWALADGDIAGAQFAQNTGPSARYWPGFQRRWALGLELHHLAPGQ
ncbi:MAG: alpha/beta hydrolase family protein [Sphingomonas sp.]